MEKTNKKICFFVIIFCLVILSLSIVSIGSIDANLVASAENIPNSSAKVVTKNYDLDDNTGYYPNASSAGHPLGRSLASVYVKALTEKGEIIRKGNKNDYSAYGIVAGDTITEDGNFVAIQLKYNFENTSALRANNGITWEISNDTAKEVSGITVGEIKSGALMIRKSYDGQNWTWPNTVTGEDEKSFHTTDFTALFSPKTYNKDYLTIYTPAGEDISKGVYIKVTFAYEIRYEAVWTETKRTWYTLGIGTKEVTKREWRYRNVVEESTFYLASDSAEVAFRNASDENGIDDDGTSEIVQMAGTIKNGHGTLYGFRLNKLDNESFDVRYRINNSAWKVAKDGQFFAETGRYDFKVTTSLGTVKNYSIYVDNCDVNGAVQHYFGKGLITEQSKRIFSTVDTVPVYVAGKTYYHINAIDEFTMPLAGKITNTDTGEIINIDGTHSEKSGTITEPGNYEAELYSNKDFYGDMSGDAFRFVFKFNVIAESEIPNPMINKEMLNGLTGFSDFRSAYYGVTLQSAGVGKVTYAFADYASAYDFAYLYERGLAQPTEGGGYSYKDTTDPTKTKQYATQFDVLEAVDHYASQSVVKKYFDATDPVSYQTIAEYREDILAANLAHDVVVISTDGDLERLRGGGDPFLNSRLYRYVAEDGTISEGYNEIQFIRIADFESDTIRLIHEATGWGFEAYYGSSIARQLELKNAPSGRYKIQERTVGGDLSEYYAVYLRPGEMTGKITAETFAGGVLTQQTLSQENNELRQRVQGFILTTAENKYDPYSIIKIVKNGDLENARIFQFDEVDNLAFDEDGEYRIYLIDRLGNSYSVVFTIFEAAPAIKVNFETADATIAEKTVFVGQNVVLPRPSVADEYYEFIGWIFNGNLIEGNSFTFTAAQDVVLTERLEKTFARLEFDSAGGTGVGALKVRVGSQINLPVSTKSGFELGGWRSPDGEKHKGMYTVADAQDLTLTAVWHYPSVSIELYDGTRYTTYSTKPDERQLLPFLNKNGFKLFGWFYTEPNGGGRFYVGQITTVPNVPSMRLDAIWTRSGDTIDAPSGGAGNTILTLVDGTVYDTINSSFGQTVPLPTLTDTEMEFFGWMYQKAPLSGTIYRNGKITVPDVSKVVLEAVWKTSATSASKSPLASSLSLTNTKTNPTIQAAEGDPDNALFAILVLWAAALVLILLSNTLNLLIKPKSGRASLFRKKFVPLISVLLVVALAGLTFAEWPPREKAAITAQNNVTEGVELPTSSNSQKAAINEFSERQDKRNFEYSDSISAIQTSKSDIDFGTYNISSVNNNIPDISITFTDEELFIYSVVLTDYMSLGYDVFVAYVEKNEQKIWGLGYTRYDEFIEIETVEQKDFFTAGFVAFSNQELIDNVETGLVIHPLNQSYKIEEKNFGFMLTYEDSFTGNHFIANHRYIKYFVRNLGIEYTSMEDVFENYDLNFDALYSYDLGRFVFDPKLGEALKTNANSITNFPNYEISRNAFVSYINQQNANGLAVDTAHITYISRAALNEYLINKQAETFLGVDVEDIYLFESQLSETQYYAVMPDGSLQAFELPPDPEPTKASWLDRLCGALVGTLMVAVGVIVGCAVTALSCGAAATLGSMISGGLIGAGIEVFMETAIQGNTLKEVNWVKVGVAALSGALCAIPGVGWFGAAMIGGGTNAAMTAIDGGSLKECLTSFVAGVATGVIIHGATKVLNKAAKTLATKLGRCFVAGTAVLAVVDGVLVSKNIEHIREGDVVASRNDLTGSIEYKKVNQIFRSEHTELVKVSRSDGQIVTSSIGHPYYVIGKGYIEAQNLRAGDKLLTVNGEAVIVEFIQHEILETPQILFNFAVDGNSNYYVAEGNSTNAEKFILVHNRCGLPLVNNESVGSVVSGKPIQKHHFLTNKSKKFTPEFKEMVKKYDLDLNGSWNIEAMEHLGRHPYDYHRYMIGKVKEISDKAGSNKELFLELFDGIKKQIMDNPEMLTKHFWK